MATPRTPSVPKSRLMGRDCHKSAGLPGGEGESKEPQAASGSEGSLTMLDYIAVKVLSLERCQGVLEPEAAAGELTKPRRPIVSR